MSNYVPFDTPGGVIWVQVENSTDGTVIGSASQSEAFASFQDVAHAVTENAQFLRRMLVGLAPSSVTISFGIKADLLPGTSSNTATAVFGLAKGTEQANYNIKLTWEAEDDTE
jgi:hypothetical protein